MERGRIMLYTEMSCEELQNTYTKLKEHFDACKTQNLKLNMARGKPSKMQLDLANDIFNMIEFTLFHNELLSFYNQDNIFQLPSKILYYDSYT